MREEKHDRQGRWSWPHLPARKDEVVSGYLLSLPAALGIFVFIILPILMSFYYSFYDASLLNPERTFVGLKNYGRLLGDATFLTSVGNTLVFLLMVVPGQYMAALIFALALNSPLRGIALFRTLYYLPVITSMVVVAIVWMYIYDPMFGLLNYIITRLGLPAQGFLTDPVQVLPALTGVVIWKNVGYYTLIFLAGLQDIPEEYYEAAQIDGANRWQLFRHITLPLLSYTSLFVIVTSLIENVIVFTPVYVMTRGGPATASTTVVFYIYKTAFHFHELGYASAMAFVLFALMFVLTLGVMRLLRKEF